MGYTTAKIDTDFAKLLARGGEVVSASKAQYFNNDDWKKLVGAAELKSDNRTIFFGLAMGCFVEYVMDEALTEEEAKDAYAMATNNHYNYNY